MTHNVELYFDDPKYARRRSQRVPAGYSSTVRLRDASYEVTIIDVSAHGCFFQTAQKLYVGEIVYLVSAEMELSEVRIVRHDGHGEYGCELLKPRSPFV
jgi:hypothetical protein